MALKFQKILRLNPINMQSLSGFDLPNSVNPCIQFALHLAILQFCWFFVSSFSLILPSPCPSVLFIVCSVLLFVSPPSELASLPVFLPVFLHFALSFLCQSKRYSHNPFDSAFNSIHNAFIYPREFSIISFKSQHKKNDAAQKNGRKISR